MFRQSIGALLGNIGSYYGHGLFLYFAQLSGVITLFACLVTLARMRYTRELTALLASGVSLYRVAVPVLGFGLATTALWFADTELIIPSIAHNLARRPDDVAGTRGRGVWFVKDRQGALLSAQLFVPRTGHLQRLLVLERDDEGRLEAATEADDAHWEAVSGHPAGGRWMLARGLRRVRGDDGRQSFGPTADSAPVPVTTYESDLSATALKVRQSWQWIRFLNSAELARLADEDRPDAPQISQARHARVTSPMVNMVLLLLGVPFFLTRTPGNVLADGAKCLVVCGLCFGAAFVGQNLVRPEGLTALPSWLPIIIFAPLGVVLMDRVRS